MAEPDSVQLTLNDELMKESLIQSMEVHKNNKANFTIKKHGASSSSSREVIIFAFKGSLVVNDLYHDDLFGETNVDQDLFPALRRVGEDIIAKVNRATQEAFSDLLKKSSFKMEVEKVMREERKILFTGHSFGGALASLATLWVLDEYKRKHKKVFEIGCVTFGSPLIGDANLTHAVRREKWAGHFTHVVMEHDIVPRMMLAPKSSIKDQLPTILNLFQQELTTITKKSRNFFGFPNKKTRYKTTNHDQSVDSDKAIAFFENVMINASTAASHDACDLMENTNSLKDKLLADFVKVSPYRPFGIYVFCTQNETPGEPRQQLVVENPSVVLQLLFYFLQLPNDDPNLAEFAVNSVTEHLRYEEELNKKGLEKKVNLKDLNVHLLTSNGAHIVRNSNNSIFKLDASAKWCLIAAENEEERKKENEKHIKKSMKKYNQENTEQKIIEDILEEIRHYINNRHASGTIDYYEAFKLQNTEEDFVANVNRLELAKIWDVVEEMLTRKDLPDEFEGEEEWVSLGTVFRRLVEPLDIANYYRHSKGDGKISYLKVRPKRYKFTQRWYEHAKVKDFKSVSETNFVAQVEDLKIEVEKPNEKSLDEFKEEFEKLEKQVQEFKDDETIKQKDDVFWGEFIMSQLREKLQ